jgi:hypothetical protein
VNFSQSQIGLSEGNFVIFLNLWVRAQIGISPREAGKPDQSCQVGDLSVDQVGWIRKVFQILINSQSFQLSLTPIMSEQGN